MRKGLLALLLLGLSACANLPLPRTVSNGHFSAYAPFGFFSGAEAEGRMSITMPETTNGMTIERISDPEAFEKKAQRDLDLTRSAYPSQWVSITEITTLGHLTGRGYKTVVNSVKDAPEMAQESYRFLVHSDGWWEVTAASMNADKSGWRSILASLRARKEPNQSPEPMPLKRHGSP